MKPGASLACLLLAASPVLAEEAMKGEVEGQKVILLPDHTWVYDDAGGERCTDTRIGTQVCALPSDWTPVPGPPPLGEPQWFMHGTDLRATFWLLGGPRAYKPLTPQDLKDFINRNRGKDSDFGLTEEKTEAQLAGQVPYTLSSVIGTTETRVYSMVLRPDGTVVLAVTVEAPSYQYSSAHRALHASFLSAIRIGDQK